MGELTVRNLRFCHFASEYPIIKDTNIIIKAGSAIVITGCSGCGKTTLLKLMTGLIKPESGEIQIDGININQYGMSNYREQIAVVMQNDQLLSGSIADNISFFDSEYDSIQIENAAKLAAIHQDIMVMPMAYNSLVGDMGTSLSGGQKQRLLLARALYKKPRILFLDEATSHLDLKLEAMVNRSIKQLNITRVIIAHRQETIDSADKVLLFEGGRLHEIR
jgi:ATP-binding cassette subfamily B protein RaxB